MTEIEPTSRHLLENGLTVLTREDHANPIVATMMFYRVGSRFEQPGATGISHFLEHMMFKGTKSYGKGEIDQITARNGGGNNAFTSQDYTAYYFCFASDRWQSALEIESDRMCNNVFDPDEFELEKQVILEELRLDQDHPYGALHQAVELKSFEKHPYRFPVIGLHQDVLQMTRAQMLEHYRSFYVPNNSVLVIVGDFETAPTLARIEELFGSIPSGPVPETLTEEEPTREQQVRVTVERPSHIPRMLLALPAPSVLEADHYGFQVLERILSEGKLSRLHRRLVEDTRLAAAVSTELNDTRDPYLFFVRLDLKKKADLKHAEAVLFEEAERLATSPPTIEELRRAKNQCQMQMLGDFETTLDQALQLGSMEILYSYEYWNDYGRRIDQLTAEEVSAVASRYCSFSRATVGILVDGNGPAETL